MSLRWFMMFMTLASGGAWIGWIFVLNTTDPTATNVIGFLLFYLTFFIAFFGTISTFGALIRLWLHPDDVQFRLIIGAFRQGFILACLFVSAMLLLSFDLLRWWSTLLLIILFSFVELFFSNFRTR